MTTPTINVNPIHYSGHIARISVETNQDGSKRFVVSIFVPGSPAIPEQKDEKGNTVAKAQPAVADAFKYFSTPLSNEQSIRIAASQLRNAFPELMPITEPLDVFKTLLTQRPKFAKRRVDITETVQLDDKDQPRINPNTKVPYTNVRIEPSSEALSPEDADALLGVVGGSMTNLSDLANSEGEKGSLPPDDIPM